MRTYVAAMLISMAFITPAMAATARPPIMDPRQPSICQIVRPAPETRAAALLPGNEVARPRIDLRQILVSIILRVLCRAPSPAPQR